MPITATITAETLLLVVNNRTNSTRTSTIYNTDLDLADYTSPTTTNSAGTVTTSVILRVGTTNSTRILAFPTTAYEDYPSTYSLCGVVHTTIGGLATCLTYQDGCDVHNSTTSINSRAPTLTYPSHPVISEGVQSVGTKEGAIPDPRGWTYAALIEKNCDDEGILSSFFPDLGLWSCNAPNTCVAPDMFHETALFLTATSISMETDVYPTTTSNPTSLSLSSVAVAAAAAAISTQESIAKETTSPEYIGGEIRSISSLPKSPIVGTPQSTFVEGPPGPGIGSTPRPTPHPLDPESSLNAEVPSSKGEGSLAEAVESVHMGSTMAQIVGEQSMTSAHAMPVLTNSRDQQGVMTEATSTTPLANPPDFLPIPVSTTFTDALGKNIVPTTLAAAVPGPFSSEVAQGKAVPSAVPPSVGFVPIIMSSTNEQGSVVLSTSTAVAIAVLVTTNDAQGQTTVSTGVSIEPVVALTPLVISSTNAQGVLVSSVSYVPAMILTATDTQGSQIVGSSQLLPAIALTSINAGGSKIFPISPIVPTVTSPPVLLVGSQSMTPDSQKQYIFGSQTLTPGGVITVAGTRISLSPGGTEAIVGGSTEKLTSQSVPAVTAPPDLTIGTQIITPNIQGQYVVGAQTFTSGGIITVSGTRISLSPGGTSHLVPAVTAPADLTRGTQIITPNVQGQYVVGAQTLTSGGFITVSGTRISLSPDRTSHLVPAVTAPPDLTIGTQIITPNVQGQYVVGTQTLTPDGVITVSGTVISLAPGGTDAIVGTSTEGLGGYILSGLDGAPTGSGVGLNGTKPFTGGARSKHRAVWMEGIVGLAGLGVVMWL